MTDRMRTAASEWLVPKNVILPVRRADVMAADLSRPFQSVVPKVQAGQPVTVNWVTTPARPGSGGHTTLFRIVRYLEAHGYVNRVYFYDVYGGDHRYYESIVRRYYNFQGRVASVDEGNGRRSCRHSHRLANRLLRLQLPMYGQALLLRSGL